MTEPSQLPTDRPPLHVRDARERSRYEASLGEEPEIAAVLEYRLMEHSIALLHTEVEPQYGGQGIGSRFARAVFEDARERGLKVIPKCPFIVRWLERHPEQHDVLARPLDTPEPPAGGGLELA
jgi:predicted GNAT family acetyltransferase